MAYSDFESGRKKYQIVKTLVVEKLNLRMCRGSIQFLRHNFFIRASVPRCEEQEEMISSSLKLVVTAIQMPESIPRRNAGSHTVAQDLALRPSNARLTEPAGGVVRNLSRLYLGLMKNVAAGLLMYRLNRGIPEFFLVHPGGPFFKNKDNGVWSIPKGLPENEEMLLDTARREFLEETGISPKPPFFELGSVRQKGGKVVHAWAFEGAWEPSMGITCNTFIMEWPPRSGKKTEFPEMDKAEWYSYESAVEKIIPEQVPLLDRSRVFITA